MEMAALLVKSGADVNGKRKKDEATPLILAIRKHDPECVEVLLKNGADINQKGKYDLTPLHYAAGEGNLEIVTLLIASGADINAGTVDFGYGRITPLWMAGWSGNMATVRYLVEQKPACIHEGFPLAGAAYGGNVEVFNYLLEKLPEPSDQEWEVIRIGALKGDNVSIVKCIQEKVGIEINERLNEEYGYPLQVVTGNRNKKGERAKVNLELIAYLLKEGTEPERINRGAFLEWLQGQCNPRKHLTTSGKKVSGLKQIPGIY